MQTDHNIYMMRQKDSFLSKLFFLYVFFLPLGTFLKLPTEGVGNAIKYMSFNIAMVGSFYIYLNKHSTYNVKVLNLFTKQYMFMVVYSALAAIVLTFVLVNPPEQPLSCILGDVVLYFEVLLSVYFVQYCLRFESDTNTIYKALNWQIVISLGFGLFQFFAMSGVGVMMALYDYLSVVLDLAPMERLIKMQRGVTIFGPEPSSLTSYCLVTIPYMLYRVFFVKDNKWRYLIGLAAFFFIFLASNSTQNLMVLFSLVVCFLVLSFKNKLYKLFLVGAFIAGMTVTILTTVDYSGGGDYVQKDNRSLEYVLLGKIQDRDNYSTQMRASTIINNMKIFASNIVCGVGDGCQGFWYKENVPLWCRSSSEVNDLIINHKIPNGGGAFFPSYLSAYGLIGVVFLMVFVSNYRKLLSKSQIFADTQLLMIYRLSMIILMLACWYSMSFREVPAAIFVLVLPLCLMDKNKKLQHL